MDDAMPTGLDDDFLDDMTHAAMSCAIWTSDIDGDESGETAEDSPYHFGSGDASGQIDALLAGGSIEPESRAKIRADCLAFALANWDDLEECRRQLDSGEWTLRSHSLAAEAGHDFWLTRNGHGTGFWDGDWPPEIDDRLSASAESYGPSGLYRGDDGKVYLS